MGAFLPFWLGYWGLLKLLGNGFLGKIGLLIEVFWSGFHVLFSDPVLDFFSFLKDFAVEFLLVWDLTGPGGMDLWELRVSGEGLLIIMFLDGSVVESEGFAIRGLGLRLEGVVFLLGFEEFELLVEF